MTTSIEIKTRAHGATVSHDGKEVEVRPNSTHRINTDDTASISVRQHKPHHERVPGSEQNDALVKEVPTEKLDTLSGKGKGSPAGTNEPTT